MLPSLLASRLTPFRFVCGVHSTTAAFLGGNEYELYHCVGVGRLYRVGLLFFVLVLGATYTANLAAFLSKPNIKVLGPNNLADLKEPKVCCKWLGNHDWMAPFVKEIILPPHEEFEKGYDDVTNWAFAALQAEETRTSKSRYMPR